MDSEPPSPPPDYDTAISMRPGQICYNQTPSPGHASFQPPMGSSHHSPAATPYPPASTPTHINFEPVGLASNPYPPSTSRGHVNFQASNPVGPSPYPPISTPYPHLVILPCSQEASPTHTNFQPVTLAPSWTNHQPTTSTPAAVPAFFEHAIRSREALRTGNVSPAHRNTG